MTVIEQYLAIQTFLNALGYKTDKLTLGEMAELKRRIFTNLTDSIDEMDLVGKMGHRDSIEKAG